MDRLAARHVPMYATDSERTRIWDRCVDSELPVVVIRNGRRGYIVRYDLQHLDVELDRETLRAVRERTRQYRSEPNQADPISETEHIGGEAGSVSGDLHTETESSARTLASRLSGLLFDQDNWSAR
ncbi:hypothetical protein [Halovenus marina]|uniref:hypothetical protein n=1 Tax=Halovenus marina TaxID=3396621 RepID=UPI003F57E9AC